jgi:hypothetical protein
MLQSHIPHDSHFQVKHLALAHFLRNPRGRALACCGGNLSLFARARWPSCRAVFGGMHVSGSCLLLTLRLLWYSHL